MRHIGRTRLLVIAAGFAGLLTAAVAWAATLNVTSPPLTAIEGTAAYAQKTCTLTSPAQDSWTNSGVAGANYGSDVTFLSGRHYNGSHRKVFVQFDLSSCSIASTSAVISATLRLYRQGSSLYNTRTLQAARVSASWSQSTLTFSNEPGVAAGGENSQSFSNAGSPDWRTWTVTTHVQGFVAGTYANYGWRIMDTGSAPVCCQQNFVTFTSKEGASNWPQLVIVYEP